MEGWPYGMLDAYVEKNQQGERFSVSVRFLGVNYAPNLLFIIYN